MIRRKFNLCGPQENAKPMALIGGVELIKENRGSEDISSTYMVTDLIVLEKE